jgi:hypothetical protein
VRQDVLSLSDYDAHIIAKVQLLLDATLGLINVEQNNIIKVLTIVSVVGIPPTLIASMYGMNFKGMPEYGWSWGYPYGLAMIAHSAIQTAGLVQMARLDLSRRYTKTFRGPDNIRWLEPRWQSGRSERPPQRDRWFADSALEEAGFELFVPLGIGAPPTWWGRARKRHGAPEGSFSVAGLIVRIHLPPAESPQTFSPAR